MWYCWFFNVFPANPIRSGGGGNIGGGGTQSARADFERYVFFFFLILKQTPPNLVTFPKIYLATICCNSCWATQFDISIATVF